VHYFIRLLHEKGLLLRNYTQNIDTLERIASLSFVRRRKGEKKKGNEDVESGEVEKKRKKLRKKL
jgi:NAD-dependent SIR2 family protein deacetylase